MRALLLCTRETHVARVSNSDPVTRLNAALEGRYTIEREAARRTYLAQEPGVHRSGGQALPSREELHARQQ